MVKVWNPIDEKSDREWGKKMKSGGLGLQYIVFLIGLFDVFVFNSFYTYIKRYG